MDDEAFWVKFWGVRGSAPCPGPETVRYGGNTSCVEVRCGAAVLVLDCGTGARALGRQLSEEGVEDFDILFSHTHIDHVLGLPYFRPVHDPAVKITLWAGRIEGNPGLEAVIETMMKPPLFPLPLRRLGAGLDFRHFLPGDRLEPRPGIEIATRALNHPDGATGYRIDFGGRSLCYITDTEHVPGDPDRSVLELIADADLVIYDSTFTDSEFDTRRGWGHSSWEEGVRLADAAGVEVLVAFHHDPAHDDDAMDELAGRLEQARPGSVVAREGMVLVP